MSAQGYVNGLLYDRNAAAPADTAATDLLRAADLVRVGLAGSLRGYRAARPSTASELPLEQINYGGTSPPATSARRARWSTTSRTTTTRRCSTSTPSSCRSAPRSADRARVQILAAALNAFSQGIAYFHAGMELLRSKSMDRNSFDSGDWFNRLDWTGQDNYFGTGLPPAPDNAAQLAADAAAAGRSAAQADAGRHRAGPATRSTTCCASARARRCSACAAPTTVAERLTLPEHRPADRYRT